METKVEIIDTDRPVEARPDGRVSSYRVGSRRYPRMTHGDFIKYLGEKRVGRSVCSEGFSAIPNWVEPSYVCECGFEGLFRAETCARCGKAL